MIFDLESIFLPLLLFLIAMLYSSVGHAGASGYLAVMAIIGIQPEIMRPSALALNILVATIATYKFYRVGSFSWGLFLPLILTSIPMAYLGGRLVLPEEYYKPVVGIILLFAAWRLFRTRNNGSEYEVQTPSMLFLLFFGGVLGFLSGLTGVGGGIFLSPLLVVFRWAPLKVISGVAAAFILVNSIAGILGVISKETTIQPTLFIWAIAVILGGIIGSEYGSKHLTNKTISILLSLVLLIGGIKMLFRI